MAKPICWIIDDDTEYMKTLVRALGYTMTKYQFSFAIDLYDAKDLPCPPRVIIIDLTAISPILCGSSGHYSAIANLCCNHPGAVVVVNTAMPVDCTQSIREAVMEVAPDSIVRVVQKGRDQCVIIAAILEENL